MTQPNLSVYRIIDANLDRAREGLRTVEEWCRFGLNNPSFAASCKQMRQELAKWHSVQFRLARNTPEDTGTQLSHPQEEERGSLEALLQANICRVQEALRVLEEYGKLCDPHMGLAFKQMRYQVYTLESNIIASKIHTKLNSALLYLITSPSERLMVTVEGALQGGLTLVQYRDKSSPDFIRLDIAKQLCDLCHYYGALFIVNDRVDIALAVGADGVHLGQQDLPISIARQLLGPYRIIGASTTNPQEMEKALADGADYIGVGPVYETPTKAGKAAAGLEYVHHALENSPIPWFAIGGIDPKNLNDVLSEGADRVAVVRSIMQSEQPTLVTQYLLAQLTRKQHLASLNG